MSDQQQSMHAIAGSVLTPADHAVMGAQLGQAGLADAEVSNLMRLIEETAFQQAKAAARNTALSLMPVLTKLIQDTHYNGAMEIHRRLSNKLGGFGGVTAHRGCAQIAWDVAQATPRHVPPAASPIIGSVR